MKVSELIQSRRKDLGLTQIELADLADVSTRSLFELENGSNSMSLKRVLRILEALGLKIRIEVAKNE